MTEPKIPVNGYAFKPKTGGEPLLMLFLGDWDSIDNYEEISREEYEQILAEQKRQEEE